MNPRRERSRFIGSRARPGEHRREPAACGAEVGRLALIETRGNQLHLAVVDVVPEIELERQLAVVTDADFVWTTENQAVAVVSETGVVTGVAVGGPVTVRVSSEGKSATANITVTPSPAIALSSTTVFFCVSRSGTLKVAPGLASPRVIRETRNASGSSIAGPFVAMSKDSLFGPVLRSTR